jgi:hypothetical protein
MRNKPVEASLIKFGGMQNLQIIAARYVVILGTVNNQMHSRN